MVEDEVLEEAWPSDDEHRRARDAFERIRDYIDDEYGRDARLMGSLAKRTFISGDKDLDIFVFFGKDTTEDELEEEGLAIGEDVFEYFDGTYVVEFAEHPYTKGEIDGFEVEIVPAYDIDAPDELRSSVDRTPLHTDWVDDTLDDDERKEVVLLKAFLKGRGLYGSSLRVEGFSGYLCEILIARYGGFRELLEAAVGWEQETVIDVEDHHGDGLPDRLVEKFSDEDLVVIDPTDPDRNVASVLSSENYARFIHAAWRYLQEPDREAFFPEEPHIDRERVREELEARGEVVVMELERPDVVDDILYPQLRRLMDRMRQELRDNEFQLFDSAFFVTDAVVRLVFDLQLAELPERVKHSGPRVFHNSTHLEEFASKYDTVWVEGDRLTTIVERDQTHAEEVLERFLVEDNRERGVPTDLTTPMAEARFIDADQDEDDWYRFLARFLHLV